MGAYYNQIVKVHSVETFPYLLIILNFKQTVDQNRSSQDEKFPGLHNVFMAVNNSSKMLDGKYEVKILKYTGR